MFIVSLFSCPVVYETKSGSHFLRKKVNNQVEIEMEPFIFSIDHFLKAWTK